MSAAKRGSQRLRDVIFRRVPVLRLVFDLPAVIDRFITRGNRLYQSLKPGGIGPRRAYIELTKAGHAIFSALREKRINLLIQRFPIKFRIANGRLFAGREELIRVKRKANTAQSQSAGDADATVFYRRIGNSGSGRVNPTFRVAFARQVVGSADRAQRRDEPIPSGIFRQDIETKGVVLNIFRRDEQRSMQRFSVLKIQQVIGQRLRVAQRRFGAKSQAKSSGLANGRHRFWRVSSQVERQTA